MPSAQSDLCFAVYFAVYAAVVKSIGFADKAYAFLLLLSSLAHPVTHISLLVYSLGRLVIQVNIIKLLLVGLVWFQAPLQVQRVPYGASVRWG